MKKKLLSVILFLTGELVISQSRSVSIGSLTPDHSSILDLESSTQGFLMTRLDSTQIVSIASPAKGLLLYNLSDQCFWYNRGYAWKKLCPEDSLYSQFISTNYIKTDSLYLSGVPIQNTIINSVDSIAWLLKGNVGINAVNNFIGTINPVDWVVKTNNTERVRILSDGNVGIGINAPMTLFSVGKGYSDFRVDTNGVTYLQNGTAKNPQLTFINDHKTGLYRPGSGDFGIAVNGNTGLYLNGLNQNMYFGFTGSYTTFGINGSGNIAMGDAQMSGSYNFSLGGKINGTENICLETSYNYLPSSITGTSCVSIGTINTINNAPGAGPAYVFGNNNIVTTSSNGSEGFLFGTSNTFSANNSGIAFLIGSLNNALTGATSSIAIGGLINLQNAHALALSDWDSPLSTQRDNELIASFNNGYELYSNTLHTNGVTVAPGGGSWASTSDRNAKENFREIHPDEILIKFCSMPVTEWSYISQRITERNKFKVQPIHIGIMAQDFNSTFGYGEFDNRITQTDIDGVLSASVKALYERTKRIVELQNELNDLKDSVNKLQQERNNTNNR